MKRQVNRRRARFSHKSHKISFSANSVVTHRYKNQQPKTLDRRTPGLDSRKHQILVDHYKIRLGWGHESRIKILKHKIIIPVINLILIRTNMTDQIFTEKNKFKTDSKNLFIFKKHSFKATI